MKRLRCLFFCFALVAHLPAIAQETKAPTGGKVTKPLLFEALPAAFEVDKAELQKIFSAETNQEIKLQLSPKFSVEGGVVDKIQHNPGSLTVNIRVSNYDNALFNVTLRLLADNSTGIQGRMLHPRYADVLELYKEQEKYFIKKNSQALFMPE